MRIVSLVPSWTEYIVDLGLASCLVGRTKFCVRAGEYPENIPIIGGTKRIHLDHIERLQPDIVIASKEENTRKDVEACSAFTEVLITDVRTVESAFATIVTIGEVLERKDAGVAWRTKIEEAWGKARPISVSAIYAIWQNPFMVAGHDTYIHAVMNWWGIGNAAPSDAVGRYPELNQDCLAEMTGAPVMLSSEPYPFAPKHCEYFTSIGLRPLLVDGEAFSWYGSRMLHAVDYLRDMSITLSELPELD